MGLHAHNDPGTRQLHDLRGAAAEHGTTRTERPTVDGNKLGDSRRRGSVPSGGETAHEVAAPHRRGNQDDPLCGSGERSLH